MVTQPSAAEVIGVVLTGIGSVSVAVFTFLVWKLQKQSVFANLRFSVGKVLYDPRTNNIVIESLVINTSQSPAVVEKWKVLLHHGSNIDDMSSFKAIRTKHIQAEHFISRPGWLIGIGDPTALSLEGKTSKAITEPAKVDIEIIYSGGRKKETKVSTSIAVESV